ncbi:hypothetical protein L596_023444 [Steinernema carpocapsae]|uniref:Uncharacterized protein n=1 Tax=Steinernema carpocapsae TaxID=34508 RepID=A0A4V6XVU3_STECR|nr:hypothetical protein L596_023444 [Steinernema carpocapsae]
MSAPVPQFHEFYQNGANHHSLPIFVRTLLSPKTPAAVAISAFAAPISTPSRPQNRPVCGGGPNCGTFRDARTDTSGSFSFIE